MTSPLLAGLFALLTATATPCADVPDLGAPHDDDLRALYEQGRAYGDFLGAATRRKALWDGNTERATAIDASLVARARAVGGRWHFLAVAVDSCSDSVSTIPYLAELVSRVDGLELRIVDSTVGRAVMETHRTPDGRPSTPTVLLLDDGFEERGCFIERPPALQTWILEQELLGTDRLYDEKMAWYDEDAGEDTARAFVEMLEAAARGETVCR